MNRCYDSQALLHVTREEVLVLMEAVMAYTKHENENEMERLLCM